MQEVFSTFGVPFLLKIKHNEMFSNVKERIQKKLDVPDKEFEKVSGTKVKKTTDLSTVTLICESKL